MPNLDHTLVVHAQWSENCFVLFMQRKDGQHNVAVNTPV